MDARFHYYGNPVGAKFQRAIGAAGKAMNDSTLPDATQVRCPRQTQGGCVHRGLWPPPSTSGGLQPARLVLCHARQGRSSSRES